MSPKASVISEQSLFVKDAGECMQIPKVDYHITNAKLGMNQERPHIKIQQQQADIQIKQKPAELKIDNTFPTMKIDQKQFFADLHLKHVFHLVEDWAARGKRDAAQGISRTNSQGDMMMKIENDGNAIAKIAESAGNIFTSGEVNIGFVPSSIDAVKIRVQPGNIDIKAEIHDPEISVKTHQPTYQVERWKTNFHMKQYPSIRFDVSGLFIDQQR